MIKNGDKYLVTSDSWFYGPDGHQYRAAWGTCEVLSFTEAFGFAPARPSTNWFMRIGDDQYHVILAGCQIHQLVKLSDPPTLLTGTAENKDGDQTPKNNILITV